MSVDFETASRLAYIRHLHQLGIDQARLPEPLSSASILMLHDAVEIFLLLAAEHYDVTPPREFERYFTELASYVPGDGGLAAVQGMRRLNRLRVALKHHGGQPSTLTITQIVSDTTTFLTANTPLVFGVDYQTLSMVQVISQPDVRGHAEAAEAASARGDYIQAMKRLRLAFTELFAEHKPTRSGRGSEFSFGPSIGRLTFRRDQISRLLNPPESIGRYRRPADEFAEHLTNVIEVVKNLQLGMRMAILGIDYPSYLRFRKLTPSYTETLGGTRHWRAPAGYAPDEASYGFCMQFIVTASLRLAAAESQLADLAWMSRDRFGPTRWEDLGEEPVEVVGH